MVAATKPGSTVKLQLWRNRTPIDLSVVVAEASEPKTTLGKPVKTNKIPNRIGLVLSDLDKPTLAQLGIAHGVGVQQSEGAAARAGVQAGDIFVGVGNISIASVEQFNTLIANTRKNANLAVLIKRADATLYVPLQVE